jgi:hypothetical protein
MLPHHLLRPLLFSALLALTLRAAENDGFVPLYNGKDLTGWRSVGGTLDSWKANGEILSCIGGGGPGWLTYEKEYGDFTLKVDWKVSKDGNSGVGLRYPATGKKSASQEGMEIQILDDDAPQHANLKPAQYTGSIYELIVPKRKAAKPVGEWNTYEITCKGSQIVIVLNGVEVVNVDADKETVSPAPGKLAPLSARPRKGFVALQNHGTKCDFKNVLIKDLSAAPAKSANSDGAGDAIKRALGGIGK